jgi:NAD(P)H dehydrogenase (quinone)
LSIGSEDIKTGSKILIIYYSKTGNTKKIAEAIAAGAKKVENVVVEVKNTTEIDAKEALSADGFAFGSPSYFTLMSGQLLSLFTELFPIMGKLSGRPMVAFATGVGSQTCTVENIECILKAHNPNVIQPGLAAASPVKKADIAQGIELGEKLAKAVVEAKK